MSIDLSSFKRFSKTYEAGQIVFCEYEPGESFYLIQTGQVKIVKVMGTVEKTIDVLDPGEFFGEMALLENAPRSASCVAIDKCQLLEFNRNNFGILMMGNPQLALRLLKLFAKRIYDQKRRLSILTLDDDLAKVADVFVMLNEQQSEPLEETDSGKREFNCTRDDIAHWAGMTSTQCTKILNHFQMQDRISLMVDRIVVTNIHDFLRFVRSQRKNQES